MTSLALNLCHEQTADNFAGAGGASEGIEQALGRPVDLAINHDAVAIAAHTANHPGTRHAVADVWDINPDEATGGQPVGLAWFSPDCRHHSKAKGGRPVSKSVRGLAWVSVRWAARVKPRAIILENVEEFLDWGPLVKNAKGHLVPDPKRKGQMFRGFVRALQRHGYEVDWRILRACDYGTPTIRKRLFLIARRDSLPISWPKATHGDPAAPAVQRGKLAPYRTAAECIDWSIPCPSIFGRKKTLAAATLDRIANGVMRFVVQASDPFIAPVIASAEDQSCKVAAFVAKHYTGVIGDDLRKPLPTITATDHNGLVTVSLTPAAQASGAKPALVAAFLAPYYGTGSGETGRDLRKPLPTITTTDRFQLVTVTIDGESYTITDIGTRMFQPHELAAAQGFPASYQFAEIDGKPVPKRTQVRLIGNSVCPPLARALVEANFTHEQKFMAAPANAA
ncbi:DNA cytosine methyltransferase [Salinicola acroporae]|uniref:DNA cytosine methyltransferase n=2 Tax=Salinicola acroporae TaxID=1541440 RepID=UPI000DA26349|nr:DNA cytosine methyltransferase [Salinicola acroporae]